MISTIADEHYKILIEPKNSSDGLIKANSKEFILSPNQSIAKYSLIVPDGSKTFYDIDLNDRIASIDVTLQKEIEGSYQDVLKETLYVVGEAGYCRKTTNEEFTQKFQDVNQNLSSISQDSSNIKLSVSKLVDSSLKSAGIYLGSTEDECYIDLNADKISLTAKALNIQSDGNIDISTSNLNVSQDGTLQSTNAVLDGYLRTPFKDYSDYLNSVDDTNYSFGSFMTIKNDLSMIVRTGAENNAVHVFLPNDPEYIGSRIILVSKPTSTWDSKTSKWSLTNTPLKIISGVSYTKYMYCKKVAGKEQYTVCASYQLSGGDLKPADVIDIVRVCKKRTEGVYDSSAMDFIVDNDNYYNVEKDSYQTLVQGTKTTNIVNSTWSNYQDANLIYIDDVISPLLTLNSGYIELIGFPLYLNNSNVYRLKNIDDDAFSYRINQYGFIDALVGDSKYPTNFSKNFQVDSFDVKALSNMLISGDNVSKYVEDPGNPISKIAQWQVINYNRTLTIN